MSPFEPQDRHKSSIRSKVWSQLRSIALPDSRFHHDYSSFIPDFIGSTTATSLLCALECYIFAPIIFIAPDNCLQELRFRALKDGKVVFITTYGIRRGFWVLDPMVIKEDKWEVTASLDGRERYGRHVTLKELQEWKVRIELMVTGTGAVNLQGLRFGKGHGFFDLERAMLSEIKVVTHETKVLGVPHECQVLDEELVGEEWDTACDFIITNEKTIEVEGAKKPDCGILWERLAKGMLEGIEPLRELREMQNR